MEPVRKWAWNKCRSRRSAVRLGCALCTKGARAAKIVVVVVVDVVVVESEGMTNGVEVQKKRKGRSMIYVAGLAQGGSRAEEILEAATTNLPHRQAVNSGTRVTGGGCGRKDMERPPADTLCRIWTRLESKGWTCSRWAAWNKSRSDLCSDWGDRYQGGHACCGRARPQIVAWPRERWRGLCVVHLSQPVLTGRPSLAGRGAGATQRYSGVGDSHCTEPARMT